MKTATMVGMGVGALRHKATGWRAPLNVMLSVTNRCNARCSYCNIPQRKQRELTTAEIIDLVDLLAERGAYKVVDERWLPAITIELDESPLTRAEVDMLRGWIGSIGRGFAAGKSGD